MTDERPAAEIVTGGSLSARIIRACPTHTTCPLTCKQRRVEDLGEIASFSNVESSLADERSWRQKFVGWMESFSQTSGGKPA